MNTFDQLFTWSLNDSLRERIHSSFARPKPGLVLRMTLVLVIIGLAIVGLAEAADARKFVTPEEFKEHFARVGMAETMHHTEFLGVTDGVAAIRMRTMNPLTRKWNEQMFEIEVEKLDPAFRAEILKGKTTPGASGEVKAKPGKAAPAPFPGRGDWGPEIRGLSCRITPEKTEYRDGEAMRVLVELRNASGEPVSLAIEPRAGTEKIQKVGPPPENVGLRFSFSQFLPRIVRFDPKDFQSHDRPRHASTQQGWFPMPNSPASHATLLRPNGTSVSPPPVESGKDRLDSRLVLGPSENYSEVTTTGIGWSVEEMTKVGLLREIVILKAEIGLTIISGHALMMLQSNGVRLTIEPDDETILAKRRVREFERSRFAELAAAVHRDEFRDSPSFQAKVKAFFAGLDSRQMRLEAIRLLDSRSVYLMNQGLAVELLGPLIRDGDRAVRARAVYAIAYRACGAAYARELIAMLEGDPGAWTHAWTQVIVAVAMGKSKHEPFLPHLKELSNSEDDTVRHAANFALGTMKEPAGLPMSLPSPMAVTLLDDCREATEPEEAASTPQTSGSPLFEGRGEWGPETEGMSCRVTPDKTEYKIGDEVRLLVEVRNTSAAPLSLGMGALSTIHAGDNKPFSTKQSGTLGITFAQAKEGKQGFFSTSEALFPKGTEFETRTVVVQPRTTHSEVLALTPWGPTRGSIPSTAQPGKMNVSGALMQVLKPDGNITHLEFKPVEITVKAKEEGAKPMNPTPANDDVPDAARLGVADFEEVVAKAMRSYPRSPIEEDEVRNSKEFQDWLLASFANLNDKDMRLKAAAILSKRLFKDDELAAELVGPLIRDEDREVKLAAAQAIGNHNWGARYAGELAAMLDGNPSDTTVLTVVLAMSRVTEEALRQPVVNYLEKLTSSPDAKMRLKGVDAMIRFYAPLARQKAPERPWPWLLPLLDDPDALVRGTAVDGLPLFGANGVELALRMLDDTKPHVRERALRTLEKLHDPKACGAPSAAQNRDANEASFHGDDLCLLPQPLCAKSCAAIAKRLADPDPDVRAMAAAVLGRLQATQYMAGVMAMLGDKEFLPRLWAVEALGEMGDPSQIEKMRPLLKDPEEQIRTAAAKSIAVLTAKISKAGQQQTISTVTELHPTIDDAAYRAITQSILTKVATLKGQFPILEKMQVPEVAENGEASMAFEHGVTWVLDDPTQKHSKTNGRRAVFEKDGVHFRLHFYRGRWEGAAMFIPVNFGDLNLWFTYEYRQGDDPAIIVAISKIIEEAKAKFENQNVDSRSGGSPAHRTTASPAANGEQPLDPAWAEIKALLGLDVGAPEVKKFVADHQLSEITKGPSGSFTPEHHAYSLLYRENRISTVVLRVSTWPEESGEKHWRVFVGDLPAGIQRNHLRKDVVALLGEPITKAGDTWQAVGLELWIFLNRTTGVIDELYISKQKPPNLDTPAPEDETKTGASSQPAPNGYAGETSIQAGTLIVPETSPQANELERLVNLYTDEEALAFRAKLRTLKYPTTTQAACEALGIDLKRLTGKDGLMMSSIDGRVGQSLARVSPSYSISFQFQVYLQGPDGKLIQNDKGEIDKVSIYHRVETRSIGKKDDKVEVSIHDDTLFVDVLSPSGIGDARLALTSGAWPKNVVVRLKYAADKPFTRLEGPGATLEKEGEKNEYLRVEHSPKMDGYEASIPPTERKTLYLHWVDAYR